MINKVDRTIREDGITISTIKVICLSWYGPYETGILIPGLEWRIAEGYETLEQAIEGHKKYSNMTEKEINNIIWIG